MEKTAIGIPSWATKGIDKGVEFGRGLFGFGSKAPKALPPGPAASSALVPHATANPAGYAAWSAQASKAAPGGAYGAGQAVNRYAQPLRSQLGQTAGGAVLGATSGDQMPGGHINQETGRYEGGGTGSWEGNAAAGAVAFNPWLNRMMGGRGAGSLLNAPMRAAQGGLLGSMGGQGLDAAAHYAGMDGTNFGSTGGLLGTGFGATSGLGRTFNKMAPNGSPLGQFGKKMQQFGEGGLAPVTTPIRAGMKSMGMGTSGGLGAPTNWLGRQAGTGTGSTAFGAMNAATGPGGFGRQAAMGVGGFMGLQNLAAGAKRDAATTFRDTADNYLEARLPELQQYGRNSVDQYMQDRGVMDEQGHFNPLRPAMQGVKQQMGSHVDQFLQQMGMDPSRMSPMQKMMLLGGGAAAGGGLMAGSPLLAAGGGLAAMGGLLPHLMPGQGQQQLQGQFQQPGQPQQGPQQPPWMRHISTLMQGPQRNEFQHQQQLQQPQG